MLTMKVVRNVRAERAMPPIASKVFISEGHSKGSIDDMCNRGRGIHKNINVMIPMPEVNALAYRPNGGG